MTTRHLKMGAMTRTSGVVLTCAVAAAIAGALVSAAPGQPSDGKPLIANARVTVFDRKATPSEPLGHLRSAERDVVVVAVGKPGTGSVAFLPKGKGDTGADASAVAQTDRAIVIQIKDGSSPHYQNTSGHPAAFPRPGSKRLLDNSSVVVWDYTWKTGVPTPVHFHDKDVIVVYLEDGVLKSTDPSGTSVDNEHYFGYTKFNPGNRVHTETLVRGKGRAIIVELK